MAEGFNSASFSRASDEAGPESGASQSGFALQTPLTALLGRERDLEDILALLDQPETRLLTLMGPGGIGKTRLAIEAGRRGEADFADGLCIVALAPLRDPDLILPVVANRLGVPGRGGRAPLDTLVAALRDRHFLLLLDNFEHLLHPAPSWLNHLLGSCPRLKVLVTSRTSLRIDGEQRFVVQPLPLPDSGPGHHATETAALTLFAQRARAVDPSFTLNVTNIDVIAAICARLDGLPLAIELAAARIAVLTPEAILSRLSDRFRLLTGGQRDAPARMRSMRDAISWSYDLLGPEEQRMFAQLAVFTGGFTLDAVEAVCTMANRPEMDTLSGLVSLVEHSLVLRVDTDAGGPRYAMLETIREFAEERLAASGEEDDVRNRHATWFLEYIRSAASVFGPFTGAGDLGRLTADHANLRGALTWLDGSGRASDLAALVNSLRWFWYIGAHFAEGGAWYERVLTQPGDHPADLRCDLLTGAAFLEHYRFRGNSIPREYLQEAVTIARDIGDAHREADATFYLAVIAEDTGHYAEAAWGFRHAHGLFGLASNTWDQMECDYHLGIVAYGMGDLAAARRLIGGAEVEARRMNDRFTPAWCRDYLILFACDDGDADAAMALLAEQHQEIVTGSSQRPGFMVALAGVIATVLRNHLLAARLFGAHHALSQGTPLPLPEGDVIARYATLAREHAGVQAFDAGWAEGRRLRSAEVDAEIVRLVHGGSKVEPRAQVGAHRADGLTSREVEVLCLLVDGMTNAQIAERLYISQRTAATHVRHIFDKLGVSSRAAAVAWAIRSGLA